MVDPDHTWLSLVRQCRFVSIARSSFSDEGTGDGPPEIFNRDQGSQFTSVDFTDVLKEVGLRISMDGTGRWMDNVCIERLWHRSNTSASPCPSSPLALRPGPASAGGGTSTTGAGPTRRSTVGRPKRRTLATKLTGAWGSAPPPASQTQLES